MRELPVRRLWGVGPKGAARLSELGVESCLQLQAYDQATLVREFGSFGLELYHLCRGIDERPVENDRMRKTLSNECTYAKNLESLEDCETALHTQHRELLDDLRGLNPERKIAKVLVKLKFSDHRRTTAEMPSQQADLPKYRILLRDAWGRSGQTVRLLGLGVRFAETQDGPEQLELF
jgi:DNA polymerase-4